MIEDLKPDFKTACEKADEILVCSNSIKAFPFSMAKVIEEFTEIEIRKFSSIGGYALSPAQIVGSNDGALFSDGHGHFIMYYNEKMPWPRIRFTAAHELGHYMLNHDMELISAYRQTKDARFESLYKKYEAETGMFSSGLLMSESIITVLYKRGCTITPRFLEEKFGVSNEAAKIRIKNMRKTYSSSFVENNMSSGLSYDDIIARKFEPFIDKIAPRRRSYIEEIDGDEELEKARQAWA